MPVNQLIAGAKPLRALLFPFVITVWLCLPSQAATLFEDNFSSGAPSPNWASRACCQWVNSSWYHNKDTNGWPRDSMALVHDADPDWKDYRVSLKAQFVNSAQWQHFNVLLRANGYVRTSATHLGAGYELEFKGAGWGSDSHKIWLVRTDYPSSVILGVKNFTLPTTPILVTAEVQGSHIRAWVNGVVVFDIVDPNPLPYGGIGVHNVWETEARFDDVVVTTISDAPTQLVATATSANENLLTWNDFAGGTSAYRVERKDGACNSLNNWVARTDTHRTLARDTGLTGDGTFSYRVAAYLGGRLTEWSSCVTVTMPAQGSPAQPTAVTATARSPSNVRLDWEDASTNETSFVVLRKTGNGAWTALATLPRNTESFVDRTAVGHENMTQYSYDILACNLAGCSSANPLPAVTPFAPTNLDVNAGSLGLRLAWSDKSNDETDFEIMRKIGGCGSSLPLTLIRAKENTTAIVDSSVISKTTYAYVVRARRVSRPQLGGRVYSAGSNCASATAP